MNQDNIGKFIRELRHEKHLSQYQLADMIPISRQAISKWERGESIPDSSTLLRLSEIFKVTINELLNGKRLKTNSIKDLENATLSIIDENNKRQRKIKRYLNISIIIITILLLTFLSYYFINSYNTTKVYMISSDNHVFRIRNGVFISTKEKNYMKLGIIEYNNDIEINNIKLYYKIGNKEKIIVEDKDIENFTIMDLDGYAEKFSNKEIKNILNNSYIEITYNNDSKEIIKLNYKRDFINNNLFFKEKINSRMKFNKTIKYKMKKVETGILLGAIDTKKEDIKEESKKPDPKLVEEKSVEAITEHPESIKEIEKEPENNFNLDNIINNLKENSLYYEDTYIYESEDESTIIIYYEEIKQISAYINDEFMWDYYIDEDRYNCSSKYNDDCSEEVINLLKENFN